MRTLASQADAVLRSNLEDAEAALANLDGVLFGQGYIVECESIALKFEISDGKAQNPQPCSAQTATRFSKPDAERLAASVLNGNKNPGQAIHVKDALRRNIANLRDMPFDECPDCGYQTGDEMVAQTEREQLELAREELQAWRERFPQYTYRPQDHGVFLK